MTTLGMFRRINVAKSMANCAFCTSSKTPAKKSFELLIVGGGAGGCATAAKFASKLGRGRVAVIEPKETHYYQPLWTLVGGGQKPLEGAGKPMGKVLPKDAVWIKDKVVEFNPAQNLVTTAKGDEISYEYLVIAVGLQLHYDKVKGLVDALETPGVGSNYSKDHVLKTWKAIQNFKEGNAVFTHPNTPIKCGGAPQKIMYLTERILTREGKIHKANIMFETSLKTIFAVEKYAEALWKVIRERNINVNFRSNLVEVKPDSREAIFQNLDKPEEFKTIPYEMLHVTPPMGPPNELKNAGNKLVDDCGWLTVNMETLQHDFYYNIFGIGDCTNVPTAKTAAAIAGKIGVLKKNLAAVMDGKEPKARYDGYTSCPLVTGPGECILAEFDFSTPPQPKETFPFNQARPMWMMYEIKAHIMPIVYWTMMRGYWEGPAIWRKILHLGMSK